MEMKRALGGALAKLFLLLGHVYGGNKSVDKMIVQPSGVVPDDCVEHSKFVEVV